MDISTFVMGYFGSGGGGASEREQMVPKRGPVRPTRSYACEGVLIFFDILDLLDFSSSSKYWNILMEPKCLTLSSTSEY